MMQRHIKPPSDNADSNMKLSTFPNFSQTYNVLISSGDSASGTSTLRLKRSADGSFKDTGYNGVQNVVGNSSMTEDVDSDLIHSLGDQGNESDSPSSIRDRASSTAVLSNVNMPDFTIIEHLTELYFRYLNNQSYAFLHKPSFIPRLKAGQVNPLLVLAVCAVSARFSRHPSIMTQPRYAAGEPFLIEARKLLSQEFDEPTVETTQALQIMGFNDFCGLNGGRAAIYSGLSMRMAATLGLNKESPDSTLSWLDREIRRKTWWSVLVLDRLAHSGPKRSFLLTEEESQVSLPSSDHAFLNNIPVVTEMLTGEYSTDDPELPRVPLDLPGYHIKSVIMWGHVAAYVNLERKRENFAPWTEYSEFHKLEREIDNFYSSLPSHLVYSRDNLVALDVTQQAGTFVHMHVAIQQCLCALHRCIYPYDHLNSKFDAPPISFIERSANKLTAAACAISGILNDTLQVQDVLPAAFVGFGAYNSATVHIVNAFSSDPAISMMAKKHLTVNLKFLVLMREYWSIAGSWCTTLKERYFHKLQAVKHPEIAAVDSEISRPPSPTVRYGTLDYTGPESSPSVAKSDVSSSSNGEKRAIKQSSKVSVNTSSSKSGVQLQPQSTTAKISAPKPVRASKDTAAMQSVKSQRPQDVRIAIANSDNSNAQQVSQTINNDETFTDTLILPSNFPPIEDEQPNPYLYEFDDAWLRALENNKDQIVIDADRVGENSFLDFGSANWFIDMPAQTLPPRVLGAGQTDTNPGNGNQSAQIAAMSQNNGGLQVNNPFGDSFFAEIFGDNTWYDTSSAQGGQNKTVSPVVKRE
ncbi:fungal-specific transcription factor domain-containing protein [Dipodascopsis uninucleata]